MGYSMKTVTGKDIYEAMKRDGFGALRGDWFVVNDDNKIEACILGTAAINLGIAATDTGPSLYNQLNRHQLPALSKWAEFSRNIGVAIVAWFDANKYDTIRNQFDNDPEYSTELAEIMAEADSTGNYSSYENIYDERLREYMNKWTRENGNYPSEVYLLETWEEALEMAKEILTFVWDTEFDVREHDYSADLNFAGALNLPAQIDTSAPSLELGLV
jgi:hypothetical protein